MSSRLAAVLLFAFAAPVSGQSQSWLYVTSQSPSGPLGPAGPVILREVGLPPGGPGQLAREIRMAGTLGSAPVVTIDGRFVAWSVTPEASVTPALALFDRSTGQTTVLPGLGGQEVLADPLALRLFVLRASTGSFIDTIVVLEPGLVRQVAIPPIRMTGPLSPDGRDLYVSRQVVDPSGTSWSYHIAVLDPLTGAERRQLPAFEPFNEPVGIAVSRDGTRLFVTMEGMRHIRALDGVTGAELASTTIPLVPTIQFIAGLTFDEQHDRLFVNRVQFSGSAGGSTTAVVLDPTSLATIGGSLTGTRVLDRTQRIVLGIGGFADRFSGCRSATVETWADGSAPISSLTVALDGGCPRLGLATAPEAPAAMSSTISGRRVTLDWTPVAGAMDYQIEAGTASGLADVAVFRTGASRPLVVNNVPPGTYYARLRAINWVGPGPPSIERAITIQ